MRRTMTRWTHVEVKILRELAGEVPLSEIAHRLDRSGKSIRAKACQERLKLSIEKKLSSFEWAL